MKSKTKVLLLFGGESSEHEVSLQSANSVFDNIDRTKFDVLPVGIDKSGHWHIFQNGVFTDNSTDLGSIKLLKGNPGPIDIPESLKRIKEENIDVVFSLIHGETGEDGVLQGFFNMLKIPIVGPGVTSSSVCMDKDFTKRILKSYGLNVSESITLYKSNKDKYTYQDISPELDLLGTAKGNFFIKPANEGSSVGVNKVSSENDFTSALAEAFKYDDKILIEEEVIGREIECAVIGNEHPKASLPGEIIAKDGFYNYEKKYLSSNNNIIEVNSRAKLNNKQIQMIQEVSLKVYKILGCKGMSRIDFFLTKDDELIVNEVNTIPGFTYKSLYPEMWANSGLDFKELISMLLELALEDKAK